jgi:hypothetical protein
VPQATARCHTWQRAVPLAPPGSSWTRASKLLSRCGCAWHDAARRHAIQCPVAGTAALPPPVELKQPSLNGLAAPLFLLAGRGLCCGALDSVPLSSNRIAMGLGALHASSFLPGQPGSHQHFHRPPGPASRRQLCITTSNALHWRLCIANRHSLQLMTASRVRTPLAGPCPMPAVCMCLS